MRGLAHTLVLTGAAHADDVSAAMAAVGDRAALGAVLVRNGATTDAQLAEAIALATNHRYIDLSSFDFDPDVIALVPGNLCRRYRLIPLRVLRNELTVAMIDPTDIIALDDVASLTDMRVTPVVAAADALAQTFERFLRSDDELTDLSEQIGESSAASEIIFTEHLDDQDADAPVVRFVNLLITQAINDRASDIHIEPGEHRLTVRFRIDGVLHEMQSADRGIQDGVISRLKIMSSIDIAERRVPQDGRISVLHEGRSVDLRVATLPTVWGEKIVMRILDNSTASLDLRDLSFLERNYQTYHASYTKPYGMILVTGPTGSGKSTTLYATLNAVSKPEINVITVEDPVEYRLPNINQVQVNPKAGLTFAGALRSILRSDPDVVLLGEIRDHETAQIAIEAALTGHLVLSTLHTNDAPSAITRLIEMGIEPFLVGSALDCVVAQRLARRLCTKCRVAYTPSPEEMLSSRFPWLPGEPMPEIFKPAGCVSCSRTGYRGRLALHEVMPVTEEIERHAVSHSSSAEITATALKQGMVALRDDGWEKVLLGQTSIEEILRVVA